MTVRIAIIGPTSYTALWLMRLVLRHPQAELTYLASQRDELPDIAAEFPQLAGRVTLPCQPIDPKAMAKAADVVFLCVPHVAAMQYVPPMLDAGLRVIDLSADYRLRDAAEYEQVYQHAHSDTANLAHAVYGLSEWFADDIAKARLVANPGCYPTTAALALLPLLKADLIAPTGIIVNAASGVTGAGRSAKANLHYPEVNEGFVAYSPGIHRHQPEIMQTLATLTGKAAAVLFVPHLLPVNNGILETIYADPASDSVTEAQLHTALEDAYADQPFVRVKKALPNVKDVRDTNCCDIAVKLVGPAGARKVVLFSTLDNMIKGASGQAIQNMNLMFNLPPTAGLL